jgi:regulator of protease activity HflC (stomatin/prohibitin superfamily)
LKASNIPDKGGSPMNISAVMNFKVDDAVAYTYSALNPDAFLTNQAMEVLRRIASLFPFRSNDDSTPSL